MDGAHQRLGGRSGNTEQGRGYQCAENGFPVHAYIAWIISNAVPLTSFVKHCGPMGLRKERVNLVPLAIERDRVRACFRRDHFLAAHCFNINDIYDAGLADRHVKPARWPV